MRASPNVSIVEAAANDSNPAWFYTPLPRKTLANAVGHRRHGLEHDAAELRLRISDNRVGFEPAKASTSAGLGRARKKTQIGSIGVSLAIWSQLALGALIEAPTSAAQ